MTPANDTTGSPLVAVASIEITESERTVTGVWPTFADVDDSLRAFAAGDGCSKVWFTVTWADGHQHHGRIDVMPEHQHRVAIVGAHIRRYAEGCTLRRIPTAAGNTREQWEAMLAAMGITAKDQATLNALLDGYDLGHVTTPEETGAEVAAIEAARTAERARVAAESQARLEATWWTGEKYDSKLTMGEVSRRVRAELVATAKITPSILAGCTFAMRSSGRAIYVRVTPPAGTEVVSQERARLEAERPHAHHTEPVWTDLGQAILAMAETLGNAYNYDRSDWGRGHDHVRQAFMLDVSFANGVREAVWEAARASVAARTA